MKLLQRGILQAIVNTFSDSIWISYFIHFAFLYYIYFDFLFRWLIILVFFSFYTHNHTHAQIKTSISQSKLYLHPQFKVYLKCILLKIFKIKQRNSSKDSKENQTETFLKFNASLPFSALHPCEHIQHQQSGK